MEIEGRRVERTVTRAAAPEWLLAWAEAGWLPGCAPAVVGTTDDGDDVLRLTLSASPDVREEPLTPYLPDWRLTR